MVVVVTPGMLQTGIRPAEWSGRLPKHCAALVCCAALSQPDWPYLHGTDPHQQLRGALERFC